MRTIRFFVTLSCTLVGFAAFSSTIAENKTPLFSSFEILQGRLEAPLSELFKHQKDGLLEAKEMKVEGKLTLNGETVPVEVRMRGWSSLGLCKFPKLMVKIKKGETKGTLFDGNRKLDLGTHCDPVAEGNGIFDSMAMNHREALIYRWLRILGISSLASRPAQMTYVDTSAGKEKETPIVAQAFFLEHLSSLQKRAKAIEIRHVKDFGHSMQVDDEGRPVAAEKDAGKFLSRFENLEKSTNLDLTQLGLVALFESFILNGDWRLNDQELWNVKILEMPDRSWLPIPIDFNLSGIAMGVGYNFMLADPYFQELPTDVKQKMIELFENHRQEILDSLQILKGDPEELGKMTEALKNRFEGLAELKKGL